MTGEWKSIPNQPYRGVGVVLLDPILGGAVDGYPHRRIQPSGVCMSCGNGAGEYHTPLLPSRAVDAPIYWRLVAIEERLQRFHAHLLMAGVRGVDIDFLISRERDRLKGKTP